MIYWIIKSLWCQDHRWCFTIIHLSFAFPWVYDPVRQLWWKVRHLVPWPMCENEQKRPKKIGKFCLLIFAIEKQILHFGLTIKGWRRLFCYSLQLSTVHASFREGLFIINFMPFTQGLWMVFVCHENQFLRGVNPWGNKC